MDTPKKIGILLVEDDDAILLVTKRLLESEGYIVGIAQHPDEAIEKLKLALPIGFPKVVITDVFMSGDGEGLIRRLSEDEDLKHIPVIPMSASEKQTIFGKKILKKPFSISEIVSRIKEVT